MSGLDLIREMRQTPRFAIVPVLVLSGLRESAAALEGLGVAGWLEKPAEVEEMLDLVQRLMLRG